eukprot:gb/GFBE01027080.1/.p1 GENE.gb/GFBE01027080.1/~~gb/GFBE01027080.1/.p1  ORF type:complete len:117 (+),score=26.03 gb/GFBE01027080.1/:1-351(+)
MASRIRALPLLMVVAALWLSQQAFVSGPSNQTSLRASSTVSRQFFGGGAPAEEKKEAGGVQKQEIDEAMKQRLETNKDGGPVVAIIGLAILAAPFLLSGPPPEDQGSALVMEAMSQ